MCMAADRCCICSQHNRDRSVSDALQHAASYSKSEAVRKWSLSFDIGQHNYAGIYVRPDAG